MPERFVLDPTAALILSSVAELIGRFWPMSEDEDKLLEKLGAVYERDEGSGESAIGDESSSASTPIT